MCSWIAMKKSLHKLHKVQNALVEMHNLLLLLCNVGFSSLHEWNKCIKGSIFPCCAFVLRLSKPVGPDILRSFVSKMTGRDFRSVGLVVVALLNEYWTPLPKC